MAVLILLWGVAGCGSQSSERQAPPVSISGQDDAATEAATNGNEISADSPSTETAKESQASTGAVGNLVGVITFDGSVPELPLLVKKDDPKAKDAAVCAAHDVPNESLVVNTGAKNKNGLANVFVYLTKAPQGTNSTVPDKPVEMDQKGCVFIPHAMIVQAGQTILVKSDDAVAHNVHTFPVRNTAVNALVGTKDRVGMKLIYQRPEPKPVAVKCDVHTWMRAYHLVLDHPFMAVTDADGRFEINNLPVGKHKFRIWHERADFLERSYEVEIKAGESTDASQSFPAERFEATSLQD